MRKPSKKTLTYIFSAVLIAAAVIFGVIISKSAEAPVNSSPGVLPSAGSIKITVTGEVKFPGIYFLPEGSLVKDAIEAAGGFDEYADEDNVLPYKPLADGGDVFVPIDVTKIP